MIPEFVDLGGPWRVLPYGIHEATLNEIKARYAKNERRENLFSGLVNACVSLRDAGCEVVYLDGSFVSEKTYPNDFDVCWDPVNVDVNKIDPVFLDFSEGRKNQKIKYGGEFFPSSMNADGTHNFVDFFQIDKETGEKKGLIRINLQEGKEDDI